MFKEISKKEIKVGDIIEWKSDYYGARHYFFKFTDIRICTDNGKDEFWGGKDCNTIEEAYKSNGRYGQVSANNILKVYHKCCSSLKDLINN